MVEWLVDQRLHRTRGWLSLLLLVCCSMAVFAVSNRTARLPVDDAVSQAASWTDESSCIDCHEQAERFSETGHAQTLRRATDPKSLALLKQVAASSRLSDEQTHLTVDSSGVFATKNRGPRSERVDLDWCFGSGHHACTWTHTLADSNGTTDKLEFRWTWFHGDVIDVTPGQPAVPSPGFFGRFGVLFDGPKAQRCFACHATYLPVSDGVIDEAHIQAGVTCQSCHGPRQAHVESGGEISDPNWIAQNRDDAVNRCAQCHRRADELPPQEIRKDNTAIVRFQPVGLSQSKCFTNSQMTCTTCHNPHTPMSAQDARGTWQCIQCHDPAQPSHVLCGAGEVDDCVRCHMPAVRMDSPVSFTDHWIRIRESDAGK